MPLSYPDDNIPTPAAFCVYNGSFDIARSVRSVSESTLFRDVFLIFPYINDTSTIFNPHGLQEFAILYNNIMIFLHIYICSTYIYVGLLFNENNSYTFPHWCIETLVEHHKSHVDGEVHLKIMVEAFFFTINFKYLKEQNKLKFQYINNMYKSRFVHVYKIKINPRLIISFTRKNLFITSKLLRKFLIVINRK